MTAVTAGQFRGRRVAFDDLTQDQRELIITIVEHLKSGGYTEQFWLVWHPTRERWVLTLIRPDGQPVQLPSANVAKTDPQVLHDSKYVACVHPTLMRLECSLRQDALDEYESLTQPQRETELIESTTGGLLRGWSRAEKLGLVGVVVAVTACVITSIACTAGVLRVPEVRQKLGLDAPASEVAPPASTHIPTPTLVPTETPTPKPTPDRALRQSIREFYDRFWKAQMDAFAHDGLDSMELYFCEDRAYWHLLDPFEGYKEHAQGLMDLELCPFEHDELHINEIPYATGGQPELSTTERWLQGSCPSNGSGPVTPYTRTMTLGRVDSDWCIGVSYLEQVVP